MGKLAKKLAVAIQRNNPNLTEIEIKKIQFGLECFFSESSKIIIYFIVFYLLSLTSYFIIGVIFFAVLRAAAGGYHEDTYFRCLFSSFVIFAVIVYSGANLTLSLYYKLAIELISILLVWIYAPVDHPNKPIISNDRRKSLKYISMFVFVLLAIIGLLIGGKLGNTAIMALFLESITLPMGYYKNKRVSK